MSEPKRMKSNEARRDWAELLQFVRTGGTVIVEHYNKPIAIITPYKEPKVTDEDEEVCGVSYDHDLKLIDERDGIASYVCENCDAEVVEETA